MSAQKVADDMRENAQQEAARIVREAEGRAELMMQKAQARVEDAQREIDGLKLKRREAETTSRRPSRRCSNTLDFIREQQRDRQHDKVLPHRPRMDVAS